jgi:hypothetical protein
MLQRVVWWIFTDVSEELTTSIIRVIGGIDRRFRGAYYHHHQSDGRYWPTFQRSLLPPLSEWWEVLTDVSEELNVSIIRVMKSVSSSETSVSIYQTACSSPWEPQIWRGLLFGARIKSLCSKPFSIIIYCSFVKTTELWSIKLEQIRDIAGAYYY